MQTVESVARSDAGLASELRLSVMRLRRRLAHERHPDNELSMGAMSVLGCLYRNGELSIGELAAQELVQPPSMTRTVSALEEAGYVARRAHETDGRQVLVSLTDKGERSVVADRRRRDEWLATRLRDLSADERAALRKATPILQRLASQE
jgi:DNA-binding MarR family transcriptional regulator